MNQNSQSQSQWQDGEAAEKSRDLHRLSMISAWMVPVIVCVVVIVLSLAVAGFLLGDK
jgi:hypothetical protein